MKRTNKHGKAQDYTKHFKIHQKSEPNALEACRAQVAQWRDQATRTIADLQNVQARITKERANWTYDAQTKIIVGLLDILDDFERAIEQYEKQPRDEQLQTWFAGFELIARRFQQFLHNLGVTEISSTGPFDPQYHEAINHVTSPDHKPGDIVQTTRKGYLFNNRVLRPAQVIVAR